MRALLIFSFLFCLSCLVQVSHQESTEVKDLVQLVVMFIELTLQHLKTIDLITNKTYTYDNTDVFEGTFGFQTIRVSGLDALQVDRNNIDFNKVGSIFSFCANLSIPNITRLEIKEYNADLALINQIPLYGKGKLVFGIKDIDFALCASINSTETVQLTNFLLKPGASALEFELTGFWNNPQVSETITAVVSGLENFVMTFWSNEIKCITCILSISLEHMINDLLKPPTTTLANFKQFVEITRSDCTGDCDLSDYPLLRTIFNANMSDLFNFLAKDNNIKKVMYNLEEYLNRYLEEELYK